MISKKGVDRISGILLVGGGQLLESIGAFGYRGDAVIHPSLQTLHNTAGGAWLLAPLMISFAIPLASFSVATNLRNPWTKRLLRMAGIAFILLTFTAIGMLVVGRG